MNVGGSYQAQADPRAGRCKATACGAPLLFAETTKGNRIPLNVGPDQAGNVALELRPGRPLDLAHVLNQADANAARARGDALYMPHHATCPARKAFKRGRK